MVCSIAVEAQVIGSNANNRSIALVKPKQLSVSPPCPGLIESIGDDDTRKDRARIGGEGVEDQAMYNQDGQLGGSSVRVTGEGSFELT